MTSDLDLLKQFARENSQDAFAEVVRRHVNLVYSAALRQVRSPQLAEEISQSVFSDLARNVGKLKSETNLTAWLYAVTRRTAIDVIRKESRRQLREQIAVEMQNMNVTENSWTQIEPFLDEAMESLDETDRAAILLRYFENKNLREVGDALKISDDTAQKRVSRAVEKLRDFFSKRNVTIGASGLTILISANAVQSAPIGLAATISAAAILTGTAVSSSTAIAVTKTIAMTTLQKTLITVALVASVGTGIYEAKQAANARAEMQALQQKQAEQIQQLQRERDDATNRVVGLRDELAKADKNNLELMKLRANATRFQTANKVESDPAFQKASEWLSKEARLHEQFEQHPEQWIPEMKFLSSEEWLDQARKADLDTANGIRLAMCNVRSVATWKFASKISQALQSYLITHNQQLPDTTSQLSAYFHPPVDDADKILSRYEMLSSDEQANPTYKGVVIIQNQRTLVDHIDNAVLIGTEIITSAPRLKFPTVIPNDLMPVVNAYRDANHDGFLTTYDLEPYATTPEQKEALNKYMKAATMSQ